MVQNNADQVVNAVTTQIEQSEEVTRNNAEKDRRLVIDVLDGMADLLGIDPAALRAKLRAETIVVLDQVDTP
jgi:phage terminase small subunit